MKTKSYTFRVVIDTEEDIFRDIVILENQNFEEFHHSIIAAFGFIYNQLFIKQDIYSIKIFASTVFTDISDYIILVIAVILMGINWGLETKKWHFLINKFENLGFKKALKADEDSI